MIRTVATLAAGIGLGALGLTAARDDGEHVAVVADWDIAERLGGKDMRASAVVVTIEPGRAGVAHRHPGPGLGYVLEGEYEWAIDDQPARTLKAGDSFYEPTGCLHRVSRNPGGVKTRLLAWVVRPRDVKDVAIPERK